MVRRFLKCDLFESNRDKNPNPRCRAYHLLFLILLGFTFVFIKLVWLMIIKHDMYVKKANQQYVRIKELSPSRGLIYDRKQRELAVNIEVNSLYGEPVKVANPVKASQKIGFVLKDSTEEIRKKLSGKKKFVWLKRKMDGKDASKINEMNLEGIGFVQEVKRFYTRGSLASHVIGFANIDNRGLAGIEGYFDKYMRGIPGEFTLNADARQKLIYNDIKESVPGYNVVLTIDEYLQYVTEKELDSAMEKWHPEAAVAVMMDPYTGEILAMANKPDFDPNFPGKYNSSRRRNRAITDMYEPGSTFKIIAASAALEENLVSMNKLFDCRKGYIQVGRRRIRDAHRHKKLLTFLQVIQKSSNVGTIQIANLLGKKRFYGYMRAYGFGQKTGIDIPGEINGYLAKVKKWSGLSLACMSIGQEVGVTPLQMARAYSVIANGGLLIKPYVVSKITDSHGVVVKEIRPKVVRRVISKSTSEKMKTILKTVVQEGGTAVNAAIEGNPVAGKTGTAQMIDPATKRYSKRKYVSSFVGFVPADKPRFVLIVVIYVPKGSIYGGTVAAPVFRSISEQALQYLDVPLEQLPSPAQLPSPDKKQLVIR